MKFTVKRDDLLAELAKASGIVEVKTTIPILSHLLITAKNGELQLSSTDLELSFRSSTPAQVEKEGTGTAPLKKLYDLTRLLPSGTYVTFKLLENLWTEITCDQRKYKMVGMAVTNFPSLPEIPKSSISLPAISLIRLVDRTNFAVSDSESRYTLNGSLLVLKPKSMSMIATDGHRMALSEVTVDIKTRGVEKKILIPKRALVELRVLLSEAADDSIVEFSEDNAHIFFNFGKRTLGSRMLTGEFPNYEAVLPKEYPNKIELPCEDLIACLRRIQAMADEKTNAVRLELSPNGIEMRSSSAEYGDATETLTAKYSGPAVVTAFNVAYMLDFLTAAPSGTVLLKVKDNTSAGELLTPSGDLWRYVIMPLKVTGISDNPEEVAKAKTPAPVKAKAKA